MGVLTTGSSVQNLFHPKALFLRSDSNDCVFTQGLNDTLVHFMQLQHRVLFLLMFLNIFLPYVCLFCRCVRRSWIASRKH